MSNRSADQVQNVQDAIIQFNELLFTECDQLQRIGNQLKNVQKEKEGYPIFHWRNHWVSTYNALLAQYISQLSSQEEEIDQNQLESTVTQLVEVQAMIKKLLLLEELHSGDIQRTLVVKKENTEQKIVKNTDDDLFADLPEQMGDNYFNDDQDTKISTKNQNSNTATALGEISAIQAQKRSITRAARGSAARDVFEAETALPTEVTTAFGHKQDRKIAEMEEELQRGLTKKEKQKLQREAKGTGMETEIGWDERNLLDGITDKSSSRGRGGPKKRDRR